MKKSICTIALLICPLVASYAQVSIVAHPSVPINHIEKSDLLDYYTGEIRFWGNKLPVVIIDLKPNTDTKNLFYSYLGKSPSRMKSIWLKRMLSGEGDPPISTNTEEELLKKVESTPGAISFISSNRVTEKMKVLAVIPESGD